MLANNWKKTRQKAARLLTSLLVPMVLVLSCASDENPIAPGTNFVTRPQKTIAWPALADSPWPIFRHDPQGTGRSLLPGPTLKQMSWKRQLKGALGTPIIGADSTIYVVSSYEPAGSEQEPVLFALRPDGGLKWHVSLRLPNTSFAIQTDSQPLIDANGTIYIGVPDGTLFAFNPDGSQKWRFQADGGIQTPQLNVGLDGALYFVSDEGMLYAVNADGSLRWKAQPDSGYQFQPLGVVFSPLGDRMYLNGRKEIDRSAVLNKVFALDLAGQVAWEKPLEGNFSYLLPLVDADGNVYTASSWHNTLEAEGAYFYSFLPDGALRWQVKFATGVIRNEPTIDKNGNLYVNVSNKLVALDHAGQQRWELTLQTGTMSLICDANDVIYYYGQKIYAISARGQVLWSIDTGISAFFSMSIGYDHSLYFGTPISGGSKLYVIR